MNILVTGGAGYIGSVLVPDLLKEGYRVTVIDNFMYRQPSLAHIIGNKNLQLVIQDVRNFPLMKGYIDSADVIIPLAGIVGAPACELNPTLASEVNKESILWLLNNIGNNKQIIMPTTNSAYGSGNDKNFCDEKSVLNPISLYARDKVAIEFELMQKPLATSFRLATVFGISPRMRLDLLVNNFVLRAMTDGFIVLFESHFKRNFVHLSDVSKLFLFAIQNPEKVRGQVFNFGFSEANISKLELCELIQKFVPDFIFIDEQFRKDPDQRNYIVSNDKIEKLGFKAQRDLTYGIQELLKGLPMFKTQPFTNL
jgi:nucleoside-diphosphate-sugar epimerase